jgi:hypothetical protein
MAEGMKASRTVTLQGGKALVLLTVQLPVRFSLPVPDKKTPFQVIA